MPRYRQRMTLTVHLENQNQGETQLAHYLKLSETDADVHDTYNFQMSLLHCWNKHIKKWIPRDMFLNYFLCT
jgi:hypothetical protein